MIETDTPNVWFVVRMPTLLVIMDDSTIPKKHNRVIPPAKRHGVFIMKRLTTYGLALALGFAIICPAAAQYGQNTWNKTGDIFSSASRSTSFPIRRPYTQQDQQSPSDLAPAPGPDQIAPPIPIPGNAIAPGAPCDLGGSCDAGNRGARTSNWVVGINGLWFSRDYEDDIGLSYNATPAYLSSTDADHDFFGGVEAVLSRRNCNGQGTEFRYWGLFPSQSDVALTNGRTVWSGLQWVTDPTSGNNVYNTYNVATDHRIYRNSEFHNFEANLLSNGGTCGRRSYEWVAGFRWFEFDENFRYNTVTNVGGYSSVYNYELDASNTLLGFQMGGRKELCLSQRLRLHLAGKAGVFNNYIRHRQSLQNGTGTYGQINSGPYNGQDYNYASTKNDLAVMGELDLGMSWQFQNCWRLRTGYRVVGFSGVALAPDQIPSNFQDAADIQRIDSNGSLILHGFYTGAEFSF